MYLFMFTSQISDTLLKIKNTDVNKQIIRNFHKKFNFHIINKLGSMHIFRIHKYMSIILKYLIHTFLLQNYNFYNL